MSLLYLDTSALAKVIVDEQESPALREYLADGQGIASSALSVTELLRTIRRIDPYLEADAVRLLDDLRFVALDEGLLRAAALVSPISLRSLDAIHIASALVLRHELDALVTYDHRMADAAQLAGLAVAAPA